MALYLFGIPNCNSVKKAKTWLADQGVDYEFIDFKKIPPSKAQLDAWINALGLDVLINKKGTTWRNLDDAQKLDAAHEDSAERLLAQKPSLIKRPLIVWPDKSISVGYDEALFKSKIS